MSKIEKDTINVVITELLKELNQKRERLSRIKRNILQLPDLSVLDPYVTYVSLGLFNDLELTIPFNRAIQAKVKELLITLGWQYSDYGSSKEEEHRTYVVDKFTWVIPDKDPDKAPRLIWLSITYSLTVEGAICERVQVGTNHKEYDEPIYEIVCKEGAKEEALVLPKPDPELIF